MTSTSTPTPILRSPTSLPNLHVRTLTWLLVSITTTGCVSHRNWDLSPAYDHVPIPSPVTVMPVQVCAGEDHGATVDIAHRKLANRVWPEVLWNGLHLAGPPREDRRAKSDWFCDFASYQRDNTKASEFALNALQRDELAKIFAEHPTAKSIVMPYFSNLTSSAEITRTVTDSTGTPLVVTHTGHMKHSDEGAIVFGVFVFTTTDIAYMTASVCGGSNPADCYDVVMDADYTNANEAVVKRLRGFPWKLLGLATSPTWEGVGYADASLLAEPAPISSTSRTPAF
jgi:hypothetical protein